MTVDEIIGCVIGGLALIMLFAMLIFMCKSSEKSEQSKRDLYNEVAKYYRHRNEQFEEDIKNE